MATALVCIAKNEDNYIHEWIAYNKKLGFDKIILYENDWKSNIEDDFVEVRQMNGGRMQITAYNHFLKNNTEYSWAAFFDVDEFLVLLKHKNVNEFINDYFAKKNPRAISLAWYVYGDNGQEMVVDGNFSVLERFTMRGAKPFSLGKSIVNCQFKNTIMIDPHCCNHNGLDTSYNLCQPSSLKNPQVDVAYINHFFTKTKQEFEIKIKRGRADCSSIRDISEFDIHNQNEVLDLNALNFMKS